MHFHAPADPRLVISVIGGKPVTVVVHLPTLWGMIPLTCAGTVTRGQFARKGRDHIGRSQLNPPSR